MKKYTVQTPLIHDGKNYGKGETIELGEVNAAYLLGRGDIVDPAAKPEKK